LRRCTQARKKPMIGYLIVPGHEMGVDCCRAGAPPKIAACVKTDG
jgi:hypothetical protein